MRTDPEPNACVRFARHNRLKQFVCCASFGADAALRATGDGGHHVQAHPGSDRWFRPVARRFFGIGQIGVK